MAGFVGIRSADRRSCVSMRVTASAASLSMMPNKTNSHDAAGLAQIVRTGWFREGRIKSNGAYVVRALLSARDVPVGVSDQIENEIRRLLKSFGIMFGKKAGGFARRAEEIVSGDLRQHPRSEQSSKR